jgi:hypothetical protein
MKIDPGSGKPPLLELPQGCLVRVQFPAMPPTRTSCTVDADDGSESVTMDWDPLAARGLTREASLPAGRYRVSCRSEPARHAIDAKANYAWTFLPDGGGSANPTLGPAFCDSSYISNKEERCSTANTMAALTCEDQRGIGASPIASAAASSARATSGLDSIAALRAFGGVSDEAINEVFQVIAEVVVEEAKSKGMKLVTAKLQALLCKDLKITDDEIALPNTCKAIQSIRLEDLASTGRQLLEALVGDLVQAGIVSLEAEYSSPTTSLTPDVRNALAEIAPFVTDIVVSSFSGQEKLRGSGQRLLLKLLDLASRQSGHQELQFAVAVVNECRANHCDPARIERMVQAPERYFSGLNATALKAAVAKWDGFGSFVSGGLEVASPAHDVTETAQLKASIDLLFNVLTQISNKKPSPVKPGVDAIASPKGDTDWLTLARDLLVAAVERDVAKLAVPAVRLLKVRLHISVKDRDIAMLTRLSGALGNYLSTSVTGRTPTKEELEERRKAKKEAVKSLIESQTERRLRLGDTIVSLGSSVGFFPAGQFDGSGNLAHFRLQPTATLGFALDWHSKTGFGFHAELMPINLGSYASLVTHGNNDTGGSLAAPSPGDALSPSVTLAASYVVQSADLVLIWGPTAGYAAKAGDLLKTSDTAADPTKWQGFYVGAVLAAYIPIFDLN